MSAPAHPSIRTTTPAALRLVVVPTPQPPLVDDAVPLRLVVPGRRGFTWIKWVGEVAVTRR